MFFLKNVKSTNAPQTTCLTFDNKTTSVRKKEFASLKNVRSKRDIAKECFCHFDFEILMDTFRI